MAPFEALYGHRCKTLLSWETMADRVIIETKLIQDMGSQLKMVHQNLKEASDR